MCYGDEEDRVYGEPGGTIRNQVAHRQQKGGVRAPRIEIALRMSDVHGGLTLNSFHIMKSLPLLSLLSLWLCSCSGTHSTIREGYAYQMTEDQAAVLVDSVIRSNIANDRMLPGSKLVASGYDRSLTDTQTYTATAIAVPSLSAFAFELRHEGTMFNGPTKAKRIYYTLNERATLVGPRVSIK